MEQMTMIWTTTAPAATPQAAAEEFREVVYPDRKITQVKGGWNGANYSGTFQLVRGMRQYHITGNQQGEWTITASDSLQRSK